MAKLALLVSSLVIVATVASGQEKQGPDRWADVVRARADAVIAELREKEKAQQKHLDRVKKARVSSRRSLPLIPEDDTQPIVYPSKQYKDKAVRNAQGDLDFTVETIRKIGRGEGLLEEQIDAPLVAEAFGEPGFLEVRQVLSDNELIGDLELFDVRSLGSEEGPTRHRCRCKISGVPTRNTKVGELVLLPVVGVSKVENYRSDTPGEFLDQLFILEPLDVEAIKKRVLAPGM